MEDPQTKKQKMSLVPEDVKKSLKCCVDADTSHYAFEARLLDCGGNACKKCIENLDDGKSVKCGFCGQDHSKDQMAKVAANPLVKYLIEAYLGGLREQLVNDLNETREGFTEDRMNEDVDLRFENVECELDTRIESIIAALHEYREEFKVEMDKMKEKYKRHLKEKRFGEIRKELDSLNKDTLASDYDDFMKTHNLINESKKKFNSYVRQLNEIKLSDQSVVCKDIIGELRIPFWKKLISYDEHLIDNVEDELYRCCYLKSKNKLIMIEDGGKAIISYNLEDNSSSTVQNEHMYATLELCLGKDDQIFIMDSSYTVLVFDSDLNYKTNFKTNSIQLDCMAIDVNSDPNLLYLSHLEDNRISVWNSETGESIKTIQIDSPQNLQIAKEFIYVTCFKNEFGSTRTDSTCIIVLNKQTSEVVDRISFSWRSFGLSLDENENLITVVIDEKDKIDSENMFLYVINPKNKEVVDKLELDDGVGGDSYIFFDNKLAIWNEKQLQLIKFDHYN